MDFEFFLKLNNFINDEYTGNDYYFNINLNEINYNQFISYKLNSNLGYMPDLNSGKKSYPYPYHEFLDSLK